MRRCGFFQSLIVPFFVSLMLVSAGGAQTVTFKTLHAFSGGSDGAYPNASVVLDGAGNVYGTTDQGGEGTGCGTGGCGTVFRLTPSGSQWEERILYNFSGSYVDPSGPLTLGTNGTLYGTTYSGGDGSCDCGAAFELSRTANVWTESVIYSFLGGNDGDAASPTSGMIRDSAGNLYGTAASGGSDNDFGAVFELSPSSDGTWAESLIYAFTGNRDGYNPQGPLIFDALGNLYGTASEGGVYGNGTVFKLTPSNGTWTETTLYAFTGGENGETPFTGVIFDAAGNLYGTTIYGGYDLVGNVFKLTPAPGYWNVSTVYSFTGGRDGGFPEGHLSIDLAGNLYGTTDVGGAYQYGTVYKVVQSSGRRIETVLHSFTNGRDGSFPYAGVVLDSSDNLYGTAPAGGTDGLGVVFEITQ